MKKKRLLSLIFAVMLVSLIFVLGVSANEAPNLLFEKFVRTEEPTGPRYSATLSREIYDDEKLTEYGFIVIALEKYETAELSASTFTLDTDADFIKGVNYGTVGGKKVDKHLSLDDSYVTFSCVITNITEEYFDEGIVIRAYAVYDGETYYSAMFKSSYFVMAKKVKKSGEYDGLDSNGKELIDYIIASCTDAEGGDDEEIVQPEDPEVTLDEIMASPTLVKEHLIIPTNIREPHLVPEDAGGEENLYVYAFVYDSAKYVPVYTDEALPAIYDEVNNVVTEQYDDKLCVYTVDENGLYHIRSLGYYEDENGDYAGLEKEDVSVLDSVDKNAMFYVDTQANVTFERIVSTRYDVGFERDLYLTDDMVFVVRFYNEDDDKYSYIIENKDTAINYNGLVFNTLTYIAYNRTGTSTLENFGVVFATYDGSLPEKDSGYRFVSNYDMALDEENNWRHYYELYNPYTGEKEYDVPGIESAKKASLLGDAVEAGTLIKLDGAYVDGSTAEDYSYSWLGTSGRYDTNTIVPYTENITCSECLADYFEDNDNTSIVINSATPISVLSYSNSGDVFKWGSIRLSSSEEMLGLEKSVQCYNEKALDKNGNYVTKYFKFPKFIYKSTGEYEGGAEVCDFILIVANGDEECALDEECEMHASFDEVQNIRIVSNYDLVMNDDGNWTISYEVYNPCTGQKVYDVPSSVENAKASSLTALTAGTIVELVDGVVDETNPDTILGTMSQENLVWIKQADDDGTMTVVPYDPTAACRTCAEEYMSECSEGVYRDMLGIEHTSGKLKTTCSTVFTTLSYGRYNSSFYKWATMDITTYNSIEKARKGVLCYNDKSLDRNENYITTYSDYVKAFVCATEDDTAYFVIVIVNGDEGAAYNVECEKHTDVTLTAETEEVTEEVTEIPEPERSGPAIAGASLTAEDL